MAPWDQRIKTFPHGLPGPRGRWNGHPAGPTPSSTPTGYGLPGTGWISTRQWKTQNRWWTRPRGQAVRGSGISNPAIRPASVCKPRNLPLNNTAWLLRKLPVFAVPGNGKYRMQPVFVTDMARAAVDLAGESRDTAVDALGPEILSMTDDGEKGGREQGQRAPMAGVAETLRETFGEGRSIRARLECTPQKVAGEQAPEGSSWLRGVAWSTATPGRDLWPCSNAPAYDTPLEADAQGNVDSWKLTQQGNEGTPGQNPGAPGRGHRPDAPGPAAARRRSKTSNTSTASVEPAAARGGAGHAHTPRNGDMAQKENRRSRHRPGDIGRNQERCRQPGQTCRAGTGPGWCWTAGHNPETPGKSGADASETMVGQNPRPKTGGFAGNTPGVECRHSPGAAEVRAENSETW